MWILGRVKVKRLHMYLNILDHYAVRKIRDAVACVQTSPISFVACGKGTDVPFPHATKEIGDVCTQARDAGHG